MRTPGDRILRGRVQTIQGLSDPPAGVLEEVVEDVEWSSKTAVARVFSPNLEQKGVALPPALGLGEGPFATEGGRSASRSSRLTARWPCIPAYRWWTHSP